MKFFNYIILAELAATLVFLAAFALTLWPGPRRLVTAAVLYAAGLLVSVGASACRACIVVAIAYDSSDSGRPDTVALTGLVWPVLALGYTITAIALLSRSIPQQRALRVGKVLHLGIVAIAFFLTIARPHVPTAPTFALVYGLLWFRIREGYGP